MKEDDCKSSDSQWDILSIYHTTKHAKNLIKIISSKTCRGVTSARWENRKFHTCSHTKTPI